MNYNEFVKRIKEVKGMKWVKTHRKGDTGIGKTLEDLLGISENNIAGPDFDIYELKSGRKDSSSMLTLFTKAPLPRGANKELLKAFGYRQRTRPANNSQKRLPSYMDVEIREETAEEECRIEEKELHVTVDALKENSVGLKLEIADNRIYIANDKNVEAYYDENVLKEAFEKKYARLVYVLASNKKQDGVEHFLFNEAFLLRGFSFKRFSELIKKGIIKVDIRIGHYPDGRLHDHGTGFRVLPKYLPQCFEKIERII